MDGLNRGIEETKEIVTEMEDRRLEITQSEKRAKRLGKKINRKKNLHSLRDLCNYNRGSDFCFIRVLERGERRQG